ncbi:DUF4097 family beta strand repeat-containing protein [Brevibacillus sp. B_LB10_24]|uniref:DUF4097 family beta strand repeat-containing protein n=1 Tax=Brevibacillus sp. B_LB10_24 TaxID=3380645 RepID=UPI0038BD8C69
MDQLLKKVTTVALIGLAIGVLGSVAAFLTEGFPAMHSLERQLLVEANQDAAVIQRMEVISDAADIAILPGATDRIEVKLFGDEKRKEQYQLAAEAADGVYRVTAKTLQDTLKIGFSPGVKMEIRLPEKTFEEVKIDSKAGDITLKEVKARQAAVSSLAGDIDINGFSGDALDVVQKAGDLSAQKIAAGLSVKNNAGDVAIVMDEITKDIQVESSAGDIVLSSVNALSSAQVHLKTFVGDAAANASGMLFQKVSDNEVTGAIGTGGPVVSLQTKMGDVHFSAK